MGHARIHLELLDLNGVFYTFLARNHVIVDECSKDGDVADEFRANLPEEINNTMLLRPKDAVHAVAGNLRREVGANPTTGTATEEGK